MGDPNHKQTSFSCSQCAETYPLDELIQIQSLFVCATCKPAAIQKIKEGIDLNPKKHRRTGWKIFFYFILVLNIVGIYSLISDIIAGENILRCILELVIYPFIPIGVFGYAFRKKIFVQKLWKVLVPVIFVGDCYFLGITLFEGTTLTGAIYTGLGVVIIILPLFIFQYLALYRYSYTKTEPWHE